MASRRVVIIGAGVVGLSLAAELGRRDGIDVTVVDRSGGRGGSTRHAPGFIGLYHDNPVLTELARSAAERYEALPGAAFTRVGGLEVALSDAGLAEAERRVAAASAAGLPARMLGPAEAIAAAPHLIGPAGVRGAALYERDGTAEAWQITGALRTLGTQYGVRFKLGTAVEHLGIQGGEVRAAGDEPADDVVIACGVWGRSVAGLAGIDLPIAPTAHPYVHGPAGGLYPSGTPFVRWPERNAYARIHADRIGLGINVRTPAAAEGVGAVAELPWWPEHYDGPIAAAAKLLAEPFTPAARVNGAAALTPDGLPLLGAVPGVGGLWIAEALSLTHAAGAARELAKVMTGWQPAFDLGALAPARETRHLI